MGTIRQNIVFYGGILAAGLCGFCGAMTAATIVTGLEISARWNLLASAAERKMLIHWVQQAAVWPVIGCATICACAGWATYAPRNALRFIASLVIIVVPTLLAWYIIGSLELTPRRFKGMEHPPIYLSELFVLVTPPIIAAIVLTVMRSHTPVNDSSKLNS